MKNVRVKIAKVGGADLWFRRLLTKEAHSMRCASFGFVLQLARWKGKDALHTVSVYAGVHLLFCAEILASTRTDCGALVYIIRNLHCDFVMC